MRAFSGMMLVLLLTGTLVLAFNIPRVDSKPGTIIVPDDYATIQDAVGNASAGDTIFVRAGTYSGHIHIDKPLTLEGESNRNTTVKLLGGDDGVFGIHVTASDVMIERFMFTPYTPLLSVTNGQDWDLSPMLIALDGRATACTNNTIENDVLANQGSASDALDVIGATHNRILNNTVEFDRNALEGSCIYMYSSDYNVINYNTLTGGWVGIELDFCNNNVVVGNDISNQTRDGVGGAAIELRQSSNNVMVGNTLTKNDLGVCLEGASGSLLYHNNFIENMRQVFVRADSNSSIWDNGYPDGGNYWDDYNGTDMYSGPYQNITGSDGIGDTPYIISNPPLAEPNTWGIPNDINNTDRYPLMSPVKRIVGDVNMDGKVDGRDLTLIAGAFGAVPGDPRWNPDFDLNGDGKIDGRDMVIVATNFGATYF